MDEKIFRKMIIENNDIKESKLVEKILHRSCKAVKETANKLFLSVIGHILMIF